MVANSIPVNRRDLDKIELTLKGKAERDYLAVFIRDPQNPGLFWYRRIEVRSGPRRSGIDYFDMEELDMKRFNTIPVPVSQIEIAVNNIVRCEAMAGEDSDPNIRAVQAVVGKAIYKGEDAPSIHEILRMTAAKYHFMRRDHTDEQTHE